MRRVLVGAVLLTVGLVTGYSLRKTQPPAVEPGTEVTVGRVVGDAPPGFRGTTPTSSFERTRLRVFKRQGEAAPVPEGEVWTLTLHGVTYVAVTER